MATLQQMEKLKRIKKAKETALLLRKSLAARLTTEQRDAMGFDESAPFIDPITGRPRPIHSDDDEDDRGEEDMEDEDKTADEERLLRDRKKRKAPKMPRVSASKHHKHKRPKRMPRLNLRDELEFTDEQNRLLKIEFGGKTGRWTDKRMLRKTTFDLRLLNNSELLPICDNVIKGLTEYMNERRARDMMIAAYNLHGFANNRVFPPINPCKPMPMEDGYLNTRIRFTGTGEVYTRPRMSDEDYIRACCYIAASTLRLFTKTADNFMRAIEHIQAKYYRFYKDEFPLTGLTPDKKCVEGLKEIYTNKDVYKYALIPFLYVFSELKDPKGMCKLLYEQHLALTGMHAVSLFVRVCQFAHCEAQELSSGLWHRTTRDTLKEIKAILVEHHLSRKPSQQRKTWMYARVIDDGYFTQVQTKYCKNLVCALAYMAATLGIAGNQNVMNIVHIAKMTEEARAIPISWASKLLYILNRSDDAADGNEVALPDSTDEDESDSED